MIHFQSTVKSGHDVLRLENVDCGFGEVVLLGDISVELTRGERVALVGPNGSGKSTLLKCIAGELRQLRGEIRLGQRTLLGYYPQELAPLTGERALVDELHDLVPQWTNQQLRDLLAAFLFRGDEVFARASDLSGGEKARFALLRLILSGANLLILDEPTNHLDVYARAALEESLFEFPETVLFVTHDRYFIDKVADRVLAVDGRRLREFLGGYAEYRDWSRQAQAEPQEKPVPQARERSRSRPAAGALAAARREEERIMGAIAAVEGKLRAKQEECGQEANYRNAAAMRRLKEEISDLEAELEALYRKWESQLPPPG